MSDRGVVDFLIIGAQKSGTTAAAFNLSRHPELGVFDGLTKFGQREIEFFNQHWTEGVSWYKSHFDYSKTIIGEKTAELIHRTIAHARMHEVVPNAKLILFLRSPVERAYSQWKMATRPNWGETRSFAEVVAGELQLICNLDYVETFYNCRRRGMSNWREGYVLKGLYIDQIESILRWYPRSRIHIAISERVRANKIAEYNRIFSFLGLGSFSYPFDERFVSRTTLPADPLVCQELASFYRPSIERLRGFLGDPLPEWDI